MKPAAAALVAITLAATPATSAGPGEPLVAAARMQIGVTLHYDGGYQRIPYPNGDIPIERGVCTDVVVRAYRQLGVDLQRLVHEDMRADFAAYPQQWGLVRPDSNIDHRRVPNLATFFARHGTVVADRTHRNAFLPGDIVTWRLSSGVPHIGIVSDRTTLLGTPLVIHNIGDGAVEENVLFRFTITGHYRWAPPPLGAACAGRSRSTE